LKRDRALRPGQDGDFTFLGHFSGARLVAEQRQRLGRGAHECDLCFLTRGCESGVLAEEAIAGVDSVTSGLLGGFKDLLSVEIRRGSRALEPDGAVSELDM